MSAFASRSRPGLRVFLESPEAYSTFQVPTRIASTRSDWSLSLRPWGGPSARQRMCCRWRGRTQSRGNCITLPDGIERLTGVLVRSRTTSSERAALNAGQPA
jgi:hypothetical protein